MLKMQISSKMKMALMVLTIAAVTAAWVPSIDDSPITSDAVESLRMGINLAHHGVLSGSVDWPLEPTMYREPVPGIMNAFGVHILEQIFGQVEYDEYFLGNWAKYLKYQNIIWLLLGALSAFGLLHALTSSFWVSWLGSIAINLNIPLLNRINVNTLFTEPEAKALLLLCLFLLVEGNQRQSKKILLCAGLSFGVLALTKAIFLYVFLGLVLVLPATRLIFGRSSVDKFHFKNLKAPLTSSVILILAFSIVVIPWMTRNYIYCDKFAISERTGIIIMQRAVLNDVNPTEYAGYIYRYSHPALKPHIGKIVKLDDSEFQEGGKLQRISDGIRTAFAKSDFESERAGRPEDSITYYRKARAMRTKLEKEYEIVGIERPNTKADDVLLNLAIHQILEHPVPHVAFILPAIWRGSFLGTPLLLFALIYAFIYKRENIALVVLPPLGMVILYAIATPFLYRFGSVIMPVLVVLVLAILHSTFWQHTENHLPK